MFASAAHESTDPVRPDAVPGLDVDGVRGMVAAIAAAQGPAGCSRAADAQRVELLTALEDLKNAAAGLQVCLAEALDVSQQEQQRAVGVRAERLGQGVAEQVALARRTSPHRGRRALSLARVLRSELPHTYAALRAGRISEYAATLMAHGTACVSLPDRLSVDAQVAGDPDHLTRLGERGIPAAAAQAAYRLDPASVVERRRRAESERRVTLRPAPDCMSYLTALLPVADGVAVFAALSRAADTARAAGAPRTRGQTMADALRDRVLTGLPSADPGDPQHSDPGDPQHSDATRDRSTTTDTPSRRRHGDADSAHCVHDPEPSTRLAAGVDDPVSTQHGVAGGAGDHAAPGSASHESGRASAGVGIVLDLVMTEQQLFGTGPASEGEALIGGPEGGFSSIDADLARQLAALAPADRLWIRRLYTSPDRGELVAMDSRGRRFPPGLRRLIRFRDQHCRTPWCRAPIRHGDHARRHADQGPSSLDNAQGLCEACNYAKDAPGWHTQAGATENGHRVTITTPTGHAHTTAPPAPPGTSPPRPRAAAPTRTLWTYRPAPTVELVLPPPRSAA